MANEFTDGPTYILPGDVVGFKRGDEMCEGTATISYVDVESKTIYFTSALPSGIKAGDFIAIRK